MNTLRKAILVLLLIGHAVGTTGQQVSYLQTSIDLLQNICNGDPTNTQVAILEQATVEDLEKELHTDAHKKAFWINVYNGFIQVILRKNPELYKNKMGFFSRKQISMLGRKLSFSGIEHGILRRSKIDYTFGYLTNPFPPRYERKLRVKVLDPRIHFGLNCGAKDCPPVDIFSAENYEDKIEENTKRFLQETTDYDEQTQTASATRLFSWFRGDFGGKSGIKKHLKKYALLEKKIRNVKFKPYDWTLDLDNCRLTQAQ